MRTIPEGAWDADLNQALQAYDARDWPTLLQACERLQAAQAPDQIVRLLGSIGSLYSHQVQAQQRWMQVKPGDTPHVAFLINSSKQIAESKQPEEKPKGWKQVGLDGVASWADELRHGGANYRWGEGYRIAWTLPSGDIDLAWRIRIGNNGQRAALKNPLHFLRVVLGDAPPSTDQNVVVKHPIQELADLTVWSIGRVQSARTKLNTWLPQQVVQEPGPNDHRIRIRIIGQQASIWWDGVLLVNTPLANSPKGLWLLSEGLKCIHSDLVVHAPDGPDPEPLTLAMLADDPVALRRGDPAWVLRQAAFAGKRKILSEGIRQHPELIDAVDQSGWTPLQLAAFAGHADLARQLLEAHADPGKRNQWDWTALDYALTMGVTQTGFLAPKADGDPWQLLRQWQIQPTALRSLDAIGRLPPAFAALAMRGDVDAALATGDRDPRLAFAAVELHMDQVLERLKTAGVPLTGTWPGSNETLLHWAITRRRDPALARTLKRLGVDPHAPAAWGADAVATARSLGMERLADDLEQEPGKPAVKNNF